MVDCHFRHIAGSLLLVSGLIYTAIIDCCLNIQIYVWLYSSHCGINISLCYLRRIMASVSCVYLSHLRAVTDF